MLRFNEYIKWFILSLVVKSAFFIYITTVHYNYQNFSKIISPLCVHSNDGRDYMLPIENLIDKGEYSYKSGSKELFAFRMPGLVPVYGLFYLIVGKGWASTLTVMSNVIFDALTVVLTGLIAFQIFRKKSYFYWGFFLYLATGFVSVFNSYVGSEPVSTFALAACLHFYLCFKQQNRSVFLFWGGVFLTWAIFLRPANVIFAPLFLLNIAISAYKNNDKLKFASFIKWSFIFFLSFAVFESVWVVRNYLVTKKIIPFISLRDDYAAQDIALFDLIISWGDDIQKTNPETWAGWFARPGDVSYDKKFSMSNPFDKEVFTKDYNIDSLKRLRNLYWLSYTSDTDSLKKTNLDKFVEKAVFYNSSFKLNAPLSYRIYGKIKQFKKYLFVWQVYGSPFNNLNWFCKFNKLYLILVYYIIIIGGITGIAYAFFKEKFLSDVIFIAFFPVLHTFFHVYLGYIENRYLANVFPLYAVFSSFILMMFFRKEKLK